MATKLHVGDRRKGKVQNYQALPAVAAKVEIMAAQGISQEVIAFACDIGHETLRRYYKEQLEKGALNSNARVAAAIYRTAIGERGRCGQCKGTGGTAEAVCEECGGSGEGKDWVLPPNPTAQIWWSKNRMGWTDKERIEHVGDGGGAVITEQRSSADVVKEKLLRIRQRTANDPDNGS